MSAPGPGPTGAVKPASNMTRNLDALEASRSFGKGVHLSRTFAAARRLLRSQEGIAELYELAPRFSAAGLFAGSDWAEPALLQPSLVRASLLGEGDLPVIESLSALRFLAVAGGASNEPGVTIKHARWFLRETLARNLDLLFPEATEATRAQQPPPGFVTQLLEFLMERLGATDVISALARECERVLLQRPIMIQRVESMLQTAAHVLAAAENEVDSDELVYARWLIESLRGPTARSRQSPGDAEYASALQGLGVAQAGQEAAEFGRRMGKTGLVSRQHATLLQYLVEEDPNHLAEALALNAVGRASLAEYGTLVTELVRCAVAPSTARCVYGLSRLLNQGVLFHPPVAPGLRRLMVTPLRPAVEAALQSASRMPEPPPARTLLLAGTLSVLGQPRGVDQGHNPTCQAARAISLWSQNDVGYLLELITAAVRDDDVVMHFEGDAIWSSKLPAGLASELHTELDPVSLLLTPHLDRIYMEMSRRTIGRGEDGHRWVNPEFHGWWVNRDFASLVDPVTEGIHNFESFVRLFHAAYHPTYNGGRDLVYAQPCGVVSTGANAEFVGWHAVSIERVALDPQGEWRVYFYNPNRDKGQNWGQGIVTSTCDQGEWEGESSLPVEQFLMRLYVFHYKVNELGDPAAVPADAVARIREAVAQSWAVDRAWNDG